MDITLLIAFPLSVFHVYFFRNPPIPRPSFLVWYIVIWLMLSPITILMFLIYNKLFFLTIENIGWLMVISSIVGVFIKLKIEDK